MMWMGIQVSYQGLDMNNMSIKNQGSSYLSHLKSLCYLTDLTIYGC